MSDHVAATTDPASLWYNPVAVIIIAMLLGSDIVHSALAQSSGVPFAPVCFSFGWLAYSFSALSAVFRCDGRLLPAPDIAGLKIFNLRTGSVRTNRNWAVSRLMSTLESRIARDNPMFRDGLRITVFRPVTDNYYYYGDTYSPSSSPPEEPPLAAAAVRDEAMATTKKPMAPSRAAAAVARLYIFHRRVDIINLVVIFIQIGLAIASILPWEEEEEGEAGKKDGNKNWVTLLVTLSGIFISSCFASLPQWAAEKIPDPRQVKDGLFALTRGQGFKDIIVIDTGKTTGWLDLDKLAAAEPPRSQWRNWPRKTKKPKASPRPLTATAPTPVTTASTTGESGPGGEGVGGGGVIMPSIWTRSHTVLGVPLQLWLTRVAVLTHAALWLGILVAMCTLKSDQWYLLGIAAFGLVANLAVMSAETVPFHGLPDLNMEDAIATARVMDGIMDFETTYACGRPLLRELLGRPMTREEEAWWNGGDNNTKGKAEFIAQRIKEHRIRGYPRSTRSPEKQKQTAKSAGKGVVITSVREMVDLEAGPIQPVASPNPGDDLGDIDLGAF